MITIIRNFLQSREERKKKLTEKLNEELEYFENKLEEENICNNTLPRSCMQNILEVPGVNLGAVAEGEGECFKRVGIITKLSGNHGTIDKTIFFDNNAASNMTNELSVGCKVEYLAYKHHATDHIKVVKITVIEENDWNDETPTEQKILKEIEDLQKEKPTYFNTHQRNIIGLITERKPHSLLIDIDYKTINVCLDSVDINFIPKEGDRVYVCCNIQTDEHFVDKQGEILQEVSIHPARLLKDETCTVKELFKNWGVLTQKAYFTNDILPAGYKPKEGDVVLADLIECERGDYVLRCIKLSVLEENKVQLTPSTPLQEHNRKDNHAVTVSADVTCVFSTTFAKQIIEFICTNNHDRKFVCKHIDFTIRHCSSQIRLIDIEPSIGFTLGCREKRIIKMEVEPKTYGHFTEQFILQFETFRIKRSVQMIVCESETEAEAIRQNMAKEKEADQNSQTIRLFGGRNGMRHQSRFYAFQVWSKSTDLIPGVSVNPRRRFIAHRLPPFEVPEKLKKAYLTSRGKQDMLDSIEQMCPSLAQDLTLNSYEKRFQALIYLEEIEYFLNFRNYDRERAHFEREGEYLALIIENLAERRPSLVIGDTVRATNPGFSNDNRTYEGAIHKVLFNRILLKFNAGFQDKYNGEDYRLEFYFSRFGFRKQHAAIQRVARNLGETFLFPSRIHLRDNKQLNVDLDDRDQLVVNGSTTCPWYNDRLNRIQKQAICNILRGEAHNMPYVIFGPPGTGKTVTLVETIVQLIKLLPSSRLLVGTPSNSSADLITTRLIECNVLKAGDFIRLVSQNQIEKDLVPEHLMAYCATVDIGAEGTCNDSMIVTESGLKLKCQMKYLGRHRVTISTCSTLGNFMQMDFPPGHFTHVLIDESGQCTESEVMVPINQVSKSRGQVILAGDPRQLQAIVINRYASERGFSTSFLERILARSPYLRDTLRFPNTCGYDPRLITKLLCNYRALPSILNVYNDLFYESELLAMIKADNSREAEMLLQLDSLLPESFTRSKTHGAFFYGMLSENMQEEDSPSWYNPHEAKNVFLMTLQLYRKNISPDNIGIITPYTKQVKHLRSLFITADIAMPKIGSVEEFQGQERDIILISAVRSTQTFVSNDLRHSLGFVQSAKRMNVAISRARYLLYIFGNPHLLVMDQCWRQLIKYCVENGAYLGCDLPAELN